MGSCSGKVSSEPKREPEITPEVKIAGELRIFIRVPIEREREAIALGALFDPHEKKWYVLNASDPASSSALSAFEPYGNGNEKGITRKTASSGVVKELKQHF
jgi:Domain of unknown function (DUF5710)